MTAGLIASAISRGRTLIVFYILIIALGLFTWSTMPKENEPDIEFPYISVSVRLDGISPEDAERLLVRPLEQELRTVEGIKQMTASAGEGRASVTLEFMPEIVVDTALQDVRDRVDRARSKLPDQAEEPLVNEVKFSKFDPMLVVNLGGQVPERVLVGASRKLKDLIEAVPGVLEVTLVGVREEMLEVLIDPVAMESYGLSPAEVLQFVERNNRLVAAGALQAAQGRFAIKVPGVIESPADVLGLPIKVDGQRVVHFRDIASVRRTFKDPDSYARINGSPAVGLEVVQRTGANVITTVAQVKRVIEASQPAWPPGVQYVYSRDKSNWVQRNLNSLTNNVAAAVVLVSICLIGILGIQSALLVGLAIPGAIFAAFILLDLAGMTINMVVLFGLIMAVGMIVDGAIVVTELADRKMTEGLPRQRAYDEAARRMAWPVIASTATTLAAFAPLVMWPGLTGSFLKFLPATLIFTLGASLAMALLFIPALGSLIGRPGAYSAGLRRDMIAAEGGDLATIGGWTGRYLRLAGWAIDKPLRFVIGMIAGLIGIYIAYGLFGKGLSMFPDVEPAQGSIDIRARGDLSVQEKDLLVRQVESRVTDVPGIDTIYVRSGIPNAGGGADQIGSIRLNFADWRTRPPAREIIEDIRARVADIAGIDIEVRRPEEGPQQGKLIDIEVAADSLDVLQDTVARIRAEMERIPGVVNIEDTRPMPGIEWRLDVNRAEAAKFGADVALIGSIVQLVTNGIPVGKYRPDDADDEMDIRVRFPGDQRSLDVMANLRVPTAAGNVPITTFVERRPADATRTIMRTNMRRTMLVQADLDDGVQLAPVLDALRGRLQEVDIDPAARVTFKGGAQDQEETKAFLARAFVIALGLIGMILLTQFNSVYQSLLILTAVIFSTGGVLLGLMVARQPFSLVNCGIGVIALAGIVVNNNIVLIDTYNALRRAGMAAREAILRTGAQRLRPVMLTTITTALGLLPMAMGLNLDFVNREVFFGGPGTQWWKEMASAIVGGLLFATGLTLVLTPALLMLKERFSRSIHRQATADARPHATTAA